VRVERDGKRPKAAPGTGKIAANRRVVQEVNDDIRFDQSEQWRIQSFFDDERRDVAALLRNIFVRLS